jgi:hypothetical protein
MVILTTPASAAPSSLDRLLVAGSGDAAESASLDRWARDRGIPTSALRTPLGQGGFDAALADLASHGGQGLANSTAKLIDYPARFDDQEQMWVQPRTAALLILALALALAAGLTPRWVRARRQRHRAARAPKIVALSPR